MAIPSFYLYLQKRMLEKYQYLQTVEYSKVLSVITFSHPSKELARLIFLEMQRYGLLKLKGFKKGSLVEIKNPARSNILEHPAKLYHILNAW